MDMLHTNGKMALATVKVSTNLIIISSGSSEINEDEIPKSHKTWSEG